MARKKASFIFCDNPDCKVSFEIDEHSGLVPEGWLEVLHEVEGRYNSSESWEFCSPKCVSTWARYRDRALKGEPIKRSSGGRKDLIELAEKIDVDVKEVFDTGDEFSIQEIAELIGVNRSTVQKRVETLVMEGTVFQTVARKGPIGARFRINA